MNPQIPPQIDEILFAVLEDYSLFELNNPSLVREEIKLLYALSDTEAECLINACWEVRNGRKLPKSYRECFKGKI